MIEAMTIQATPKHSHRLPNTIDDIAVRGCGALPIVLPTTHNGPYVSWLAVRVQGVQDPYFKQRVLRRNPAFVQLHLRQCPPVTLSTAFAPRHTRYRMSWLCLMTEGSAGEAQRIIDERGREPPTQQAAKRQVLLKSDRKLVDRRL
jgi:hypothetical protein